jgi:hypothetical protein
MTTAALTDFFANDVDRLPDTWYVDRNDDCAICRVDEIADPPGNNDIDISMTAVVKIKFAALVFIKSVFRAGYVIHLLRVSQRQPTAPARCAA